VSVVDHVKYSLPHPDITHYPTLLAGTVKRFARDPPVADPVLLEEFGGFVDRFLQNHLTPLPSNSDTSVDRWLENTGYPAFRKEELRLVATELSQITKIHERVSLFMKDENYSEYKHGRGINSRSDEFKTAVGPIFKLIEEQVFKLPWFIKKIPVVDRPTYIEQMLRRSGSLYYASDYTTYEALFVRKIMQACEFQLYRYMTNHLPEGPLFQEVVERVLGGMNNVDNKFFGLLIEATRMSGEMCTSLGNGFSNLMFMLFLLEKHGNSNITGVVEGDDGLFVFDGPGLSVADFARLGLDIKLEIHKQLETASFCGLIFDMDALDNITNPVEAMLSFPWLSRRYLRANDKTRKILLRAKSLSYAWQYPACPIISAMARWGLRKTNGIHVDRYMRESGAVNTYERQEYITNFRDTFEFKPIAYGTRLLCEQVFGVSVSEQLLVEEYFDSLEGSSFCPPLLDMFLNESQRDFSWRYITPPALPFGSWHSDVSYSRLYEVTRAFCYEDQKFPWALQPN
jgi:hypothetical protein